MNRRKIVIAGGTGFIGRYFEQAFRNSGWEVVIISRSPGTVNWDDQPGVVASLEGSSALINLAGKSVDCRYTRQNKAEILRSRIDTTRQLGEAIARCALPPALWLNSSTATIYRHAEDRPQTEAAGEIGSGFSVSVAKAWEDMFFSFSLESTRQVALRIAIVLGKGGGVTRPYKNLVKCGLGGPQGSGRQVFSWIHIEDLYRIVTFILQHNEITGAINCAAPHPVSNKELMQTLRQTLHVPFGLPAPVWLLKAGAALIRTETELVLKSRWVLPEKLQQLGFTFTYSSISPALQQIFGK